MTYIVQDIYKYYTASPALQDLLFWSAVVLLLVFYRLLRKNRWQRILGASLDYHRFHLGMLAGNRDTSEKCRSLYQAMLWAVNKQLADDLKRTGGKGGMVLLMSFTGNKTCINTCGTVFYESAKNYSFIDRSVIRLNDTLISTLYRILLIESVIAPFVLIYMDMRLLTSLVTKPDSGTGRLYREMLAQIKKNKSGE